MTTPRPRVSNSSWGSGPIDNDGAADWLGSTMDAMKISTRIREGLESKYPQDVRAAAFLLQQTAYVYMYPIDDMDKDLKAAIKALRGILRNKEWTAGWKADAVKAARKDIQAQIAVLEARLDNRSAPDSIGFLEAIATPTGNPGAHSRSLGRELARR